MSPELLLFMALVLAGLGLCAALDEMDDQRRDAARRNGRRRR